MPNGGAHSARDILNHGAEEQAVAERAERKRLESGAAPPDPVRPTSRLDVLRKDIEPFVAGNLGWQSRLVRVGFLQAEILEDILELLRRSLAAQEALLQGAPVRAKRFQTQVEADPARPEERK